MNVGESIQPGHNLAITLKAMLPFAEYSVRKMTVKCVSLYTSYDMYDRIAKVLTSYPSYNIIGTTT